MASSICCSRSFFLLIVFSRALSPRLCFFFFFNDTATTEIYTLSLHDALPIWRWPQPRDLQLPIPHLDGRSDEVRNRDRKSTRLNSSHDQISYAVFCLKKKNKKSESTLKRQLV